jgi:hypothetical protein
MDNGTISALSKYVLLITFNKLGEVVTQTAPLKTNERMRLYTFEIKLFETGFA